MNGDRPEWSLVKSKYWQHEGKTEGSLTRMVGRKLIHHGKHREASPGDPPEVVLNALRTRVRVVWGFRNTSWVARFTTGLGLPVAQIIEYHGVR